MKACLILFVSGFIFSQFSLYLCGPYSKLVYNTKLTEEEGNIDFKNEDVDEKGVKLKGSDYIKSLSKLSKQTEEEARIYFKNQGVDKKASDKIKKWLRSNVDQLKELSSSKKRQLYNSLIPKQNLTAVSFNKTMKENYVNYVNAKLAVHKKIFESGANILSDIPAEQKDSKDDLISVETRPVTSKENIEYESNFGPDSYVNEAEPVTSKARHYVTKLGNVEPYSSEWVKKPKHDLTAEDSDSSYSEEDPSIFRK